MTRHPQPLSPAEMAARDDAEIDFSDQPELGTSFRAKARVVMPEDLDACPIGVRPAGARAARAGGGVAGESWAKAVSLRRYDKNCSEGALIVHMAP